MICVRVTCARRYVLRRISWLWLAFFSLHGLLLVMERQAVRWWAAYTTARTAGSNVAPWVLPRPVATFITLAVLELTAVVLFYPVLLEPDVVERVVVAMRSSALPTASSWLWG